MCILKFKQHDIVADKRKDGSDSTFQADDQGSRVRNRKGNPDAKNGGRETTLERWSGARSQREHRPSWRLGILSGRMTRKPLKGFK